MFGWLVGRQGLQLRLLLVGGVVVVFLIFVGVAGAIRAVGGVLIHDLEDRMAEIVARAAETAEREVRSRESEVRQLGLSPLLIGAAVEGGRRAAALGLLPLSVEEAEARAPAGMSLEVDPAASAYLRRVSEASKFAEIFITDVYGHTVTASNPTEDFVQRDERWWQAARDGSLYVSDAQWDESARIISLEIATPLRLREGSAPVGVLKAVFDLSTLWALLDEIRPGQRGHIQIVDARGRLLADPDSTRIMQAFPDLELLDTPEGQLIEGVGPGGAAQVGAVHRALDGRWAVIAWLPEEEAYALARRVQLAILIASGVALFLMLFAVVVAGTWVSRRVAIPVRLLTGAAQHVAAGDLTADVDSGSAAGEVAALADALETMIHRLRWLVGSIVSSAGETERRAKEIAAAVEELSAAAEDMMMTISRLTQEASGHSEALVRVKTESEAMRALAARLAQGSEHSSRRSADLRALAERHRVEVEQSRKAIQAMGVQASEAAAKLREFVESSQEIGEFVEVIRGLARKTNLLALNAAIEAARAGGEARGFAVVADEVRKLATQAGQAADRARSTTAALLSKLEEARGAVEEMTEGTTEIDRVVGVMGQSFERVVRGMSDAEAWSADVASAGVDLDHGVGEIAPRLAELAVGIQDFAAAMQQMAAGMQEQTASTEEIASAVNQLNQAAEELGQLAAVFKVSQAVSAAETEVERAREAAAKAAVGAAAAGGRRRR